MAMNGLNIRKAVGRGLFVMMAPIIGLFGKTEFSKDFKHPTLHATAWSSNRNTLPTTFNQRSTLIALV
jgi:hypothetical protein